MKLCYTWLACVALLPCAISLLSLMTEVNTNLIQCYAFVRNTMESYCALSLFHSKTGTTFMDPFSYEADFEI